MENNDLKDPKLWSKRHSTPYGVIRKFLLWAVSQSWRAGEDFPVYESFKVELLQKICKSIHDVLSRMSALHSDDSISAFKNIGISWLQKVLALWMSPDELGNASKMSLEHHLRSKDHFQAHLGKNSTFSKKCSRRLVIGFATDQTVDLLSFDW